MQTRHRFEDPENDPAMQPVYEAGGGDAEGFELAEQQLVEHASHGDEHGTGIIFEHAEGFEEERAPDPDQYGEADAVGPHEEIDPDGSVGVDDQDPSS